MEALIIVFVLLLLIALILLWYYEERNNINVIKDNEQVNHPSHYQSSNGKECIEEMRDKFGDTAVYWFCICNAFKYEFRAGNKNDNPKEQDLNKAQWYKNYAKNLININNNINLKNN